MVQLQELIGTVDVFAAFEAKMEQLRERVQDKKKIINEKKSQVGTLKEAAGTTVVRSIKSVRDVLKWCGRGQRCAVPAGMSSRTNSGGCI